MTVDLYDMLRFGFGLGFMNSSADQLEMPRHELVPDASNNAGKSDVMRSRDLHFAQSVEKIAIRTGVEVERRPTTSSYFLAMDSAPPDIMVTYDPPWWQSWRATKWDTLKSRINPREASPKEALAEVIAADLNVLDCVLSNANGFKRELTQLHLCDGNAENFDAYSDEYTSGTETPRPSSPSSSLPPEPEIEPISSPPSEDSSSTPRRPASVAAAAESDRRRRREMARKVKVAAESLKAEHKRRLEQAHIHHQRKLPPHPNRGPSLPASTRHTTPAQSPVYEINVQLGHTSSAEDEKYKAAWIEYTRLWKTIEKPSRPSTPLTFATFPWPVLARPGTVKDLQKQSIITFFEHAPQSSSEYSAQENRSSVHQAVRRWHPDRSTWLSRVAPEDKEDIRKGADIVIRVLNQLGAVDK